MPDVTGAALLNYHLAYRLQGRSPAALHVASHPIKLGSPFVSRLRTVVENATLTGLDEPYLRPLADCIAEFQPLVDLLAKPPEVGVKEPIKVEAPVKGYLACTEGRSRPRRCRQATKRSLPR